MFSFKFRILKGVVSDPFFCAAECNVEIVEIKKAF